jgi:hypothetical protein
MASLFQLLLLVAGVSQTSASDPLCSTCADWCAGTCDSFRRPPKTTVNADGTETITLYRMTPQNMTDLTDKDTGDARGDLMFTLDEEAIPLQCRHYPSDPDCVTGDASQTHQWLLDAPLVYARHTVQTSGEWGPYLHCNVNLSVPFGGGGVGKDEPHFYCRGASPPITTVDRGLCSSCARSFAGIGWAPNNHSFGPPSPPLHASCKQAVATACGAAKEQGRAPCELCFALNATRGANLNAACGIKADPNKPEALGRALALYEQAWCPAWQPLPAACNASMQQLCPLAHRPAHNVSGCHSCVRDAVEAKKPAGVCSTDGSYSRQLEQTWCGMHGGGMPGVPAKQLMNSKIGGDWFSTAAAGRCGAGETPSKSGCKWRSSAMVLKNYTCVNTNVARTVRAANASCFRRCPDGEIVYPGKDASDCWQTCFYTAVLGFPFDGTRMVTAPLLQPAQLEAAWQAAVDNDTMCPPLPRIEPPPPPPTPNL